MTASRNTTRQSSCAACGKRLSMKTAAGEIKWKPSHVDDRGMYCAGCYETSGPGKNRKNQLSS